MKRGGSKLKLVGALIAALAAMAALTVGPTATAAVTNGALVCSLPVYNPTHYAVQVGATVTCTIVDSTVPDGPIDVFIKHSTSPAGNETVTGTALNGVITFTYTADPSVACLTSIVAYGTVGNNTNNSNITPGGNAVGGLGFVDKDGNHVDNCTTVPPAIDLTVAKNATPSFTRTFHWTIDKSADKDTVYSAGGGESGAVHFTIAVTKDGGTDSDWAVAGTITVTNPNVAGDDVLLSSVSDTVDNGGACTVDTSGGLTVPGNGTKGYPYSCSYASAPSSAAGTNTVTIGWADQTLTSGATLLANTATGSKAFDFGSVSPTVVNGAIDVTDTNGGSWHFTDSGSVSYDQTYTDPAGTCTEHTNTATITQTGQHDSVTVQDCQGADLTVSKTATPSFTRKYGWTIDKAVVQHAPGSKTFDYTVTVTHNAGTDSGWMVKGTITITNANDWQDITLTSLSDALNSSGACTLDSGGPYLVPKSGSLTVDYTCANASASDTLNTATATWNAASAHTPNGSASGSKAVAFVSPTSVVDECVTVVDDSGTPSNTADDVTLGTVCVGAPNPTTFTYSKTLTLAEAQCVTYTNTAKFTTNDTGATGTSSQTVTYCAPATIGYWKTHIRACVGTEKTGTGGCNKNGPFTVTKLPQSLGNYPVTDGAKALAVFDANNCGASTSQAAVACLAAQLLGAKLSVAYGGSACINPTIALADAFLISVGYTGPTGTYSVSATQRATAIALKTALDNYNKGLGCI